MPGPHFLGMTRRTDWRSALHSYLAANQDTPYSPGTWDCSMFAAGAVEAMTGTDYAADYRGEYETVAEGETLLAADGYADQVALVAAHFDQVPPALARVGDIAVVEQGGVKGLGIVIGSSVAVVSDTRGIGHLRLTRATRAFRV